MFGAGLRTTGPVLQGVTENGGGKSQAGVVENDSEYYQVESEILAEVA